MKTLIFFTFILLMNITNSVNSQVQVILDQPPPFQFKTEDLWKVTLVNPGNAEQVYLYGTVESSSVLLLEAKTGMFNMPSGIKRVTASELSPVDVTKYSDEVDRTLTKTGSFQTGVYSICVHVFSASTNVELGSTCANFEILNISEPELIFPSDGEVVRELQPTFNWLPPTPSPGNNSLSYEIIIKEILERQTGISAMSSNQNYFSKKNIMANVFQYPLAAFKLISGNKYAWMVRTYINNTLYNESEVYEFSYQSPFKDVGEINDSLRSSISSSKINDYNEIEEFENTIKNDIRIKQKESTFANNSVKINFFRKNIPVLEYSSETKPFEFKYDLNSEFKLLNKTPVGSDLNHNILNVEFIPRFIFFGLPVSLNLYFDNQQDELKQNINSFAFLFDLETWKDKLKEDALNKSKEKMGSLLKIINNFKTIGLGEIYPNYSKYSLNGTKLTGADFEFNPGIFYFAISGLKNLDAIEKQSFRRYLASGRTGVGSKDGSHFHLTFLKAWDKENSISDYGNITPKENIVMGTSGKIRLFNDMLEIGGEIYGSIFTRDITAQDLVIEDFPSILNNLISPKISTQFDYLYEAGVKFKNSESGTKIELSLKSIGPGYVSLGSPGLRNDLSSIKFLLNQTFLNKLIQGEITVEKEQNNIANLNRTTSKILKMGFSLKLNFKNIPYIILNYKPFFSSNNDAADSIKLESNANIFTLMTGINGATEFYNNSASFMVNFQNSNTKDGSNDFSILTLLFNDNLTFLKSPFSIGGSLSFTNKSGIIKSTSFALDMYGVYTISDAWSNTFGLTFSEERKLNNKKSLYFISNLTLEDLFKFGFSIEQSFYRESVFEYGNSDDLFLKLNFSRSF